MRVAIVNSARVQKRDATKKATPSAAKIARKTRAIAQRPTSIATAAIVITSIYLQSPLPSA